MGMYAWCFLMNVTLYNCGHKFTYSLQNLQENKVIAPPNPCPIKLKTTTIEASVLHFFLVISFIL